MTRSNSLTRSVVAAILCTGAALVGAQSSQSGATLTVRKILVPASDLGRFDLQVDGTSRAVAVGNNGATGAVNVSVGVHSVSEVASSGSGIDLVNYAQAFGGDCSPAGKVTLARGDNKVCTITNTRRAIRPDLSSRELTLATRIPALAIQLQVVKQLVPASDPGRFQLLIDGQIPGGLSGGAANVGNNGTTGAVNVTAGLHTVSETSTPGTDATNYTTTYSSNCPNGKISLQPGMSETCTITNTRAHGSWTQGPGTYTVSVCTSGTCDIHIAPGQSIPIKFEAWGAGGGGGGGFQDFNAGTVWSTLGGPGGGGGGGGGYDVRTLSATAGTTFSIQVGSGGPGGTPGAPCAQAAGGDGGVSHVMHPGGTYVVRAWGGLHGLYGGNCPGSSGSLGGAGGIGAFNSWAGQPGYAGAITTGCAGGAGGLGGAGGGPGRINDGGDGGHGGWMHHGATCTAHGLNYELTGGTAGKNGKVSLSW